MTIPNSFTAGTKAESAKVNANFTYCDGLVPIGSVIAWLKSYTNTPVLDSKFVECNGQTLSDAGSVYNGQVIPNLNGSSSTQRFLRGNTTSGTTGGSETHQHALPFGEMTTTGNGYLYEDDAYGTTSSASFYRFTPSAVASGLTRNRLLSESKSTLPSYYEVVWIMRIK